MWIQSILVGMDVGESGDPVASIISELALTLESTVKAVYIEDTALVRAATRTAYAGGGASGSLPIGPVAARELEVEFQQEEWILGQRFLRLLSDMRMHGEFRVERGDVVEVLSRESRAHDLLVLGSPGAKNAEATDRADTDRRFEEILRRAFSPVLLVPPGRTLGPRYLVAYDGTGSSSRALRAALRLAQRLGGEIAVLTVAGAEEGTRLLEEAGAYLSFHGVDPELRRRSGNAAEEILAESERCDLLLMGAFGKGRLKQWVGATPTQRILRRIERPTLFCGPMERHRAR